MIPVIATSLQTTFPFIIVAETSFDKRSYFSSHTPSCGLFSLFPYATTKEARMRNKSLGSADLALSPREGVDGQAFHFHWLFAITLSTHAMRDSRPLSFSVPDLASSHPLIVWKANIIPNDSPPSSAWWWSAVRQPHDHLRRRLEILSLSWRLSVDGHFN